MEQNRSRPLVAIVDNEIRFRLSLRRLVSSWGVDAAPFPSGAEFIATLEQFPSFKPDCVILDIGTPNVNGVRVQTHLKSLRPNVPVIMVAATTNGWMRDEALAAGAVAVLGKPIEDEAFVKALHQALRIS